MNQHQLDEAIKKIHDEQPNGETVKTAAGRVFRNLFDSAFVVPEPSGKIRGCEDIRALIPAYLNRTLSTSRTLLLEDHVLGCVECRRALREARHGDASVSVIPTQPRPPLHIPAYAWAAAALLLVGVGLGVTGHLPGQNAVSASVASVQGQLYRITDIGASLVEAGYIIQNTDELRTAKGSHAFLRLAGGAMVEIAERTDVRLSGSLWRGTSLNLERGQMIIDTRHQTAKTLYVTSGEMTLPVTAGVIAVDHGIKESRVAVAKGAVDVHVGPATQWVKAGSAGQLSGGGELRLASLTTNTEFAWSQNSAAYTELLNQLAGLQKEIQALPVPGLRYSSNLPQYLPADTFLYAAIPNLGGAIAEAKKLFDARLAESAALREWWQQKEIAKNGKFDRMVDQISALSSYLGEEVVVSVGGDASGPNAGPVFIAEIKQPGLDQYLQANFPNIATSTDFHIQTNNNLLVASPSAAQIKRVEALIQNPASGGSNFTASLFYAPVAQVYKNGASTFLAANLEQIAAKSVTTSKTPVPGGLDNVQYLVLERKSDGEMSASLSFSSARQGVASWLAAPGPAGSLNFVSPDANFAASVVMKSPRLMMQELFGMAAGANPDFTTALNQFESQAGIHLIDDVAAPLGNDMTIAMEGPISPVLAVEVNDPNHLQQTIATLVAKFNRQLNSRGGQLALATVEVNGRTFYSITSSKNPNMPAYYTFVDGYLVASTSQANISTAIQNRQAGHTLTASDAFRAQLPNDNYTNFSGMIYTNLGPLGALAQQIAPKAKKNALSGLIANSGPSLVCVYGDANSISAAAKGSFLGFNLGTLVDIQQGKPLNSLIADVLPNGGSPALN